MSFTPKDWKNFPDTTTPISAAALEDLEARLAAYVDASTGGGGANTKGVVLHGTNASAARPTGYLSIEWIGSVEPLNATNNDTWVPTS